MALTPYQLPAPSENRPNPIETPLALASGNPFAFLMSYRSDRDLADERYRHELESQHDYANRSLDNTRYLGQLETLPKFLERDNGLGIALGIPGFRELLNRLPPELADAYVKQAYNKTQGAIVKDVGGGMKDFREAGVGFTPDQQQSLTGLAGNAVNPLALDKAALEGYYKLKEQELKNQAGPTTTVEGPIIPTQGRVNYNFNHTPTPQEIQAARDKTTGGRTSLTPAPLPPRPGSDKQSKPVEPNLLSGTVPGQETADALPPGMKPADIIAVDPAKWATSWNTVKASQGSDPKEIADIERAMAKNGGKPIIDRKTLTVWGIDEKGNFIPYGSAGKPTK